MLSKFLGVCLQFADTALADADPTGEPILPVRLDGVVHGHSSNDAGTVVDVALRAIDGEVLLDPMLETVRASAGRFDRLGAKEVQAAEADHGVITVSPYFWLVLVIPTQSIWTDLRKLLLRLFNGKSSPPKRGGIEMVSKVHLVSSWSGSRAVYTPEGKNRWYD